MSLEKFLDKENIQQCSFCNKNIQLSKIQEHLVKFHFSVDQPKQKNPREHILAQFAKDSFSYHHLNSDIGEFLDNLSRERDSEQKKSIKEIQSYQDKLSNVFQKLKEEQNGAKIAEIVEHIKKQLAKVLNALPNQRDTVYNGIKGQLKQQFLELLNLHDDQIICRQNLKEQIQTEIKAIFQIKKREVKQKKKNETLFQVESSQEMETVSESKGFEKPRSQNSSLKRQQQILDKEIIIQQEELTPHEIKDSFFYFKVNSRDLKAVQIDKQKELSMEIRSEKNALEWLDVNKAAFGLVNMEIDEIPVIIMFGYKNPIGKFVGHYDGAVVHDLLGFESHEKKQNYSLLVKDDRIYQIGGTDYSPIPKINDNFMMQPYFVKQEDLSSQFDTNLRIDCKPVAQLLFPRHSCALAAFSDHLYVFYGIDRTGTPINSIERATFQDIISESHYPWESLQIQGFNTFTKPMIFPEGDGLMIFGGHQQIQSSRRNAKQETMLFRVKIEGQEVKLEETKLKFEGNPSFSQSLPNVYFDEALSQWAFLDEEGVLRLYNVDSKMIEYRKINV